jgi:hypothetical protein
MDEIKESVEDLIEETSMRAMTDEQIERRVRRFTEICAQVISGRVENERKRQMLLERLEILKCFYNHSPVQKIYGGQSSKELSENQRNKRLLNIVRRRRMALQMIERTDPETAQAIEKLLEKVFAAQAGNPPAAPLCPSPESSEIHVQSLNPHHWYFLYFNLFLLCCLIVLVLSVVR